MDQEDRLTGKDRRIRRALGAKGLPVEGDLGALRQALQREPPGRTRRDLAAAHVERWGRGARGRAVRGGGRPGVTEQALRDRVVDGGGVGDGGPREEEQALLVGVQTGGAERHDDDEDPERDPRSEEHTSELQSRLHLVCRLLLEKKKKKKKERASR